MADSAYHVRMCANLHNNCNGVEDVIRKLRAGEIAVVAGADMSEVRQRMQPGNENVTD